MSTATAPPTAAATTPTTGGADQLIEQRIEEARNALWWAELVRDVLRTLIVAFVAVLAWVIIDQWIFSASVAVRLLACGALAVWVGWRLVAGIVPLLGSTIRPEYAARSLEHDLPDMKQQLTSYVTLRDRREQPGLRSRVVKSIGATVAGRLRSHDALPAEATGTFKWWIGAAAVLALFVGYAVLSPKNTLASVTRLVAPLASIDSPKRVAITDVTPGDSDAIAGRSVSVTAKVAGLRADERVLCRWASSTVQKEAELTYDDSQSRFTGDLELDHAASGEVAYYIEAGDAQAGPFWLHVQNVPVVALQSVHYQPPSYTGEVAHTSSSGAITAVDGTDVTIRATTNRAIEKATIEFNPRLLGETVRATAGAKSLEIDEEGTGLSISFPLRSAHGRSSAVQLESYRIVVSDAADQSNPDPIVYPIRVIADLPPEISIVSPRETPKAVPVDAQQIIEVHAMDPDFGLKQVTLKVQRGIDVIAEPSLWSDPAGAKGNRVTEYRFRPTEHGLRAGDVVKIAAIAVDNRYVPNNPAIEPNVSVTDSIELRIVQGEPLPDQPDGNDGLSAPDDRPASDDSGDQQSQSDSNTDNTGQGDQKQSGGGQGGEGTSSQQSGETSEGSETGKGTGTGENSEKPENGSGTGSDSESGDSGTADPSNGSDPSGQSDPNSNPDNKTPADGSPEGRQGNDTEGGEPGSQTGDPSDVGKTPQDATGDPGAENNGSTQPDSGENAGSKTNGSEGPPKHDGETFERIRDHIEKQKQQSGTDPNSPNQPEGQIDPQKDPAKQQGTDQQGTGEQSTGEQGSDTKSPSNAQTPKDKPDGGEKSGSGQNDGTDDGTDTSEQTPGDSPDPKSAEPKTGDSESTASDSDTPKDGDTEQPKSTGEGSTDPDKTEGSDGTGKPPEQGDQKDPGQASDSGPTPNGDTKPTGDNPQDGTQPTDGGKPTGDEDPRADNQGTEKSGDEPGDGSESGSTKNDGASNQNSKSPDTDSQSPSDPKENSQADPANQDGKASDNGAPSDAAAGDNAPQNANQQSPSSTDPTNSSSSPPKGTQSQANGDSKAGSGDGDLAQPPPAEPDLEYTKKATDMVLDYLKETRDEPDQELLEKLNWTEQDLKRFADRWQKVRDQQNSPPNPETSSDVEEALRSLGMRPQSSDAALQNADKADSLGGIRDAGNRKPPPAAYRDVFEAFRRNIGRQ